MRALLTAAALIAALALSACGGSTKVVTDTPASVTSTGSSSATTTAGTTTSSTSTGVSASTTSAGTGSAAGRCVAADLALSFLGQQGATGHGELGFALRNTSAGSCHTFGYPGVLFLTRSGAPLPTASTRTTHDFFGSASVQSLVLAPGATASFRVGVTHGIGSSAGCTTAAALQAIAPDDTATLRVAIPGGAYECGTATVSPLESGNGAYR
ncbi:MAG: hypothetical protein QOD66_1261 [Solirubrobacteraceae bacterium]|jgi:hypothetical protein|nr:hypothetical protein [Solirubrobacteraceae bacterium]